MEITIGTSRNARNMEDKQFHNIPVSFFNFFSPPRLSHSSRRENCGRAAFFCFIVSHN